MNGELSAKDPAARRAAAPQLAERDDFALGQATIRPSLRIVAGPEGTCTIEPLVMRVLLAFADSAGAVLTRDELMRTCWNGAIVGEDAVNRTVAEIRRVARETGGGFGIETIPRVGYRITGATAAQPAPPDEPPRLVQRRWLVAAGGMAIAGVAGLGYALRPRPDPRFNELLELGRQELRQSLPGTDAQGLAYFEEAVRLRPDDATALGLLALAQYNISEAGMSLEAGDAMRSSEQTAQRALQVDAREPSALTALTLLHRHLDDWMTTEQKLRAILEVDPAHMHALDYLVALLQAGGYVNESRELNEQALALDGLRPNPSMRKALKLWIMGEPQQAAQLIAVVRQRWPSHPFAWNAHLVILAFTGQADAARTLVESPTQGERMLGAAGVSAWQFALEAMGSGAPRDVAAARDAFLALASQSPGLGAHGTMLMSSMGETDAAFEMIRRLLRGPQVTLPRTDNDRPLNDPRWRTTQWLYTPATARVRADARFATLAQEIGLADYWRRRGIQPDEQRA